MKLFDAEQVIDVLSASGRSVALGHDPTLNDDAVANDRLPVDLRHHDVEGRQHQIELLAERLAAAERQINLTLTELRAARINETAKIDELHALFFGRGQEAKQAKELRDALAQHQQALIAKERVIRQLDSAVKAYRAAHYLLSPIATTKRLAHRLFGPRIGSFHHYNPRPLRSMTVVSDPMAGAELPSIALVTPSFGQGHFIGATVSSVLEQNYLRLDYMVQDGGSIDGTTDVLAAFGGALKWDSRRDNGQGHAINVGFSKVSGEIMGYLNSDDILLPGALHVVGRFFASHPDIDVVYGDRLVVNGEGLEIGAWRLPGHRDDVLSWADYVPQETLFWRRSAWERIGGQLDETFLFALDWDLLLRLRDSGARFSHLPAFLGAFRVHAEQKTSAQIAEIGAEEMKRLRRRALGFDPSHREIRRAILPYLAAHVLTDLQARVADRLSGMFVPSRPFGGETRRQ